MNATASPADLATRYHQLRVTRPKQYFRDAAAELGVSELELLLATAGDAVTPLRVDDLAGLLAALAALGEVKTMTRNDVVVLERQGTYGTPTFFGPVGQLLGEIDLRIFPALWRHAVAVQPAEGRASLQWFDAHGTALHKVHLERSSSFEQLVAAWRDESALPPMVTPVEGAPLAHTPPADRDAFRRDWDAMTDTHEFHTLLRTHAVTRRAGLEAAGAPRATPVALATLALLLERARDLAMPIMTFVGNRGVIQIHSGAPGRVVRTAGWLNILDPGMNLHVREDGLAEAWLVRKPARGGVIASLECFDAAGREVLLVFGKRADDAPASVTAAFAAELEGVAEAAA